jgi:hypothetical protein
MKTRSILALAITALLAGTAAEAKYSGGSGEPSDPYQIATAKDLNDIGNHTEDLDKHFILINDVNLAQYTSSQFNIIAGRPSGGWYTEFTGIFDGNGHTIKNLHLDVNTSMVGLFGYTGRNGIVQNVHLEAIDINAINYVGGIAGRNEGLIQNCNVSGLIVGDQCCGGVTGFCGYPVGTGYAPEIRDCSFRGQVRGSWGTGGIVGITDGPEIVRCYAIADIIGVVQCGGVVGHNMGGNFQSCFAKGTVTCSQSVGGFTGITYDHCGFGGDIRDCYADVTVNCSRYAGGFSGSSPGMYGEIRNCYCSGRVVYDANSYEGVGGFIGEYRSPPQGVFSSYFLETAGPDNGFGEPLTDEQMKQQSSFVGWDFVEIWGIGENQTYPYLRTEPAGDLNHDKKVDFKDFAIFASHWLEGTGL